MFTALQLIDNYVNRINGTTNPISAPPGLGDSMNLLEYQDNIAIVYCQSFEKSDSN